MAWAESASFFFTLNCMNRLYLCNPFLPEFHLILTFKCSVVLKSHLITTYYLTLKETKNKILQKEDIRLQRYMQRSAGEMLWFIGCLQNYAKLCTPFEFSLNLMCTLPLKMNLCPHLTAWPLHIFSQTQNQYSCQTQDLLCWVMCGLQSSAEMKQHRQVYWRSWVSNRNQTWNLSLLGPCVGRAWAVCLIRLIWLSRSTRLNIMQLRLLKGLQELFFGSQEGGLPQLLLCLLHSSHNLAVLHFQLIQLNPMGGSGSNWPFFATFRKASLNHFVVSLSLHNIFHKMPRF